MNKKELINYAKKWMKSKVVYCPVCNKGYGVIYTDRFSNSWHSLFGDFCWSGLSPRITGCKHNPEYHLLFINGKKKANK